MYFYKLYSDAQAINNIYALKKNHIITYNSIVG